MMTTKLQIYIDRGDGRGPVLDGCWGSENAGFDNHEGAIDALQFLADLYPDADWVLIDCDSGQELERIPAKECFDWTRKEGI